jgi:D-sedoheptulose 7-phosphate isomerase
VHKDLTSCVNEQLLGYLHGLESFVSSVQTQEVVESIFNELQRTYTRGGKIIISYDTPYEYKARHLWEELVGQYRERRPPIPSVMLLKGVASSWIGGVREKDFLVHLGTSAPSAPRSIVVRLADGDVGAQKAVGVSSKDCFICEVEHFGLLSFVVHLMCEAFEPNSPRLHFKSLVDQASEAARKTLELFTSSAQLHAVEELLRQHVCKGSGYLFLAGNGGSACDTFDIGSDLPALFLAESGYITCIANDYSYDVIYSRAVESMEAERDIFLGLSTSGRSPSIVKALQKAQELGVESIYLGNAKGGEATRYGSTTILVASQETNRTQELHSLVMRGMGNWIRQC